jgi:hypothetical protein
MPSSKPSLGKAPQISISSWIMGGPIVTKPQRSRLKPVLVTTGPAKALVSLHFSHATPIMKPPADPIQKAADDLKPESGKKTDNAVDDASKKAEDVKSNAVSKGSATEKSDDDWTWTSEQDALILKLKGDNISWKEIATKMSLAKSDIQVRFKELQKKAAETLAANTEENSKSKGGENGNEKESKNEDRKSDEEMKADAVRDVEECRNGGRLKPDENWSREDCEILEMLEARYREQKWLSMQASFYNMTGRMIRADIIERKLSEAMS